LFLFWSWFQGGHVRDGKLNALQLLHPKKSNSKKIKRMDVGWGAM